MDIEAGETPQPTNFNVGFSQADPDEAEIERQLLEAEKNGTSLGEIEDAKQKQEPQKAEAEPEKSEDAPKGQEQKPDNSETPADKQERDDEGKFRKESDYEKAKKDAARKDRSWKALDAEKEATRAQAEKDKAEIERQRAELQQARAEMQEQARNRGDFSPQEYHRASQEFQQAAFDYLAKGETEAAQKAFQDADACMQAAQRTWEYNLTQARDRDVTETCAKYPELNDVNSEAGKAMMQLLKENPYLAQLPNGFSKAAKFLAAQRDAARVSELEGQIKSLVEERDKAVAELKAATSLAGAGAQTQPPARDFDSMSDREQEAAVKSMFSPSGEFIPA